MTKRSALNEYLHYNFFDIERARRKRAQFFRIVLAQSGQEEMYLLFHTRRTDMCKSGQTPPVYIVVGVGI